MQEDPMPLACCDAQASLLQVLEFQAEAGEGNSSQMRTLVATPELLGLAPRDISLFAATTGVKLTRAVLAQQQQQQFLHLGFPTTRHRSAFWHCSNSLHVLC